MTIDDDKLDEIERCAEAATEGPWTRLKWFVDTPEGTTLERVRPRFGGDDVQYVTTADPPTVLALVEEVRRLREELSDRTTYNQGQYHELEAVRDERDRYREALQKCRTIAREQVDPAVSWSLLGSIIEIVNGALEGSDD